MFDKNAVLIVEDEETLRDYLKRMLTETGYEVLTAAEGAEGLALLESKRVDIIITDLYMPGMDGFAVLERVQEQYSEIPVIVITGYGTLESAVKALHLGAYDFILKPFTWEVVHAAIGRACDTVARRRTERELVQRSQELALLYEVGQTLSSTLELNRVLGNILSLTMPIMEASRGSIIILDESGQVSHMIIHREGLSPSVSFQVSKQVMDRGLAGWVARNRRGTIIYDTGQDDRWSVSPENLEEVGSAIAVPLISREKLQGILTLAHSQPYHFDEGHLKLLSTIANQAAVAVENARLFTEAQEERNKLMAILKSATDAVIATDEEGQILLFNPAAEYAFGAEADAAIGQHMSQVVNNEALLALCAEVASRNEACAGEISANGRSFHVSVSPVKGVGQAVVMQDITHLKELERMRLAAEQAERKRVREVFERYVSPELVDRILAQGQNLLERREWRDAVVLFADMRHFTRLTVNFPPDTVVDVLNEFFTTMVRIVHEQEGTVLDLMGDALMVAFGAPFDQPDAPQRALTAAIAMQEEFARMRQRWQAEQGIQVGLGIGINCGRALAGNIGSPSRMNFTLVGEVVTTAFRLVEMAKDGQIILSEAMACALKETELEAKIVSLPPVPMKGKEGLQRIYNAVIKA